MSESKTKVSKNIPNSDVKFDKLKNLSDSLKKKQNIISEKFQSSNSDVLQKNTQFIKTKSKIQKPLNEESEEENNNEDDNPDIDDEENEDFSTIDDDNDVIMTSRDSKAESFKKLSEFVFEEETIHNEGKEEDQKGEDKEEEEENHKEDSESEGETEKINDKIQLVKQKIKSSTESYLKKIPLIYLQEHVANDDKYIQWPTTHSVPDHLIDEMNEMFPPIDTKIEHKKKKVLHNTKLKNFFPAAAIGSQLKTLLPLLKEFWTVERLEEFVIIVLKANPKIPVSLTTYDYLCDKILKTEPIIVTLENGEKINLSKNYQDNLNDFGPNAFGVIGRKDKIVIEFKSKKLESILLPENSVTEYFDDETGKKKRQKLDLQIQWSKKIFIGARMINNSCYYYLMTTIGQLHLFRWVFQKGLRKYCEDNWQKIESKRKGPPKKEKNSIKKKKK